MSSPTTKKPGPAVTAAGTGQVAERGRPATRVYYPYVLSEHCRALVDRVWRCAFTWVCGDCYTRLAGDTDGPDVNDERPYLDYDEGYDRRDEDEGDDE